MDFFTTEVWTPHGLVTQFVLFVIDLKTRRVQIAGITPSPDEAFMAQVVRNLTDYVDGFLRNHRFLILDRDSKLTKQFKDALKSAGVNVFQAPNCNAFAERFVLSIKSECLNRMIFFGERSLRRACSSFLEHYHSERAHQGLGNGAAADRFRLDRFWESCPGPGVWQRTVLSTDAPGINR
jgi:transposase InsO family protein